MELFPGHLFYNNNTCDDFLFFKQDTYYIGNGNIFIQGSYTQHYNEKVKLEITVINSWHIRNINMIVSDSYKLVDTKYYDTIEEVININEMINIWNIYHNVNINTKYESFTSFKITGNLLKTVNHRPIRLVDYILYNQLIPVEDMVNVPNSYNLKKQINEIYKKEIFNLETEFNNYYSDFEV